MTENITTAPSQFTEIISLDETKAMTVKTIARLMCLRSFFKDFRERVLEVLVSLFLSVRATSMASSVIFIERVRAKSESNKFHVGRNVNKMMASGHHFNNKLGYIIAVFQGT